ncbi:hypothetical protein HOM50_04840 [bacterium]|jgi:hypothetical protein|nr:hypothetical protein [bacterium]MBT5015707.1 hypothetical protein [bacterium]
MKKFSLLSLLLITQLSYSIPQYYCTASDATYYPNLLNLIGSIHKTNFDELVEIAVFNLGMSAKQINSLKQIAKVTVHEVDHVHPDIIKPIVTTRSGKRVPGSYAWKPVVIKQSLDKFPYVFYLDAGVTVLKSLNDIFEYIEANGYFLLAPGPEHNIIDRSTKRVRKQIMNQLYAQYRGLLTCKDTPSVTAGLQGVSRKVYDEYVMPMYEFAKDVTLFVDDGSSSKGKGEARHDQPLFSILAHINGYRLFTERGYFVLQLKNEKKVVHIHHLESQLNQDSVIYVSRTQGPNYQGGAMRFIRYK